MQAGDAQAKNELVEHNMRLVAHIARKYTVPGYDADDLISIGTIGLIKGVSTFKSGTGTQLSTYCARCIENEILMVRSYVSRIEKRALETLCDSFKKPLPSEKSTIVQDKAARMR